MTEAPYRAFKAGAAHYFKCLTPGNVYARQEVSVQATPNPQTDWLDFGALLRAAGFEPRGEEEQAIARWALMDGPFPSEALSALREAHQRVKAGGGCLVAPRPKLADVIRTVFPNGGSGLREVPVDDRSPVLDEDCEADYIK